MNSTTTKVGDLVLFNDKMCTVVAIDKFGCCTLTDETGAIVAYREPAGNVKTINKDFRSFVTHAARRRKNEDSR